MARKRNTKQKQTLEKALQAVSGFFNAQKLHDQAKIEDESLGIATVYRFLNQKVEQNTLFKYICNRKNVFSKQKTHCHFIDEKTGKITHFDIENINFLDEAIDADISSISIEVKGKTKENKN